MNDAQITIITPAYNRCHTLQRLYDSLCRQTVNTFIWMIVDDGSVDDTKKLIQKFNSERKITIEYIYQQNGGKHRALNNGISLITTKLTFIVDSDDYLTEDAIERILKDWNDQKDWCGIAYLRGYTDDKVIGDKFPEDYIESFFHEIRVNQHISGDKAEVWRTDLLQNEPFLEFPGEKFFGEGYVWIKLSKKYPMLFVNEIIYVTEYLPGGLTKSGRKLRILCPLGGMANANELLGPEFKFKIRVKNSWLYCAYGFFAGIKIKEMIKRASNKWLIFINWPMGLLVYLFWKRKYMY